MANGGRRGISSIDLSGQHHQPTYQYERSSACRFCHWHRSRGDLGRDMEANCNVEERTPQLTDMVHLPGHLQHCWNIAHPLHLAFPEDRAVGPSA
jgi:hypothetical protein